MNGDPARASSIARMLAVAAIVATAACDNGRRAPGKDCTFDALPAGAKVIYRRGGGIDGRLVDVTVFEDGRIESKAVFGEANVQVFRVSADRVKKLDADLAASRAFTEKDGCWSPKTPVPDGVGASIVVRAPDGSVHRYGSDTGGSAPASVNRAIGAVGSFWGDVERDHPSPFGSAAP